jgi:hypothetical protein
VDEALQLSFTQAIIAVIQVHDFHKVTVGPAGPSARGFRQIERLAGMADDQPKWLLEDRKLVPFKRFESRFQVQVAVPTWTDIEGADAGRGLAACLQASPQSYSTFSPPFRCFICAWRARRMRSAVVRQPV